MGRFKPRSYEVSMFIYGAAIRTGTLKKKLRTLYIVKAIHLKAQSGTDLLTYGSASIWVYICTLLSTDATMFNVKPFK